MDMLRVATSALNDTMERSTAEHRLLNSPDEAFALLTRVFDALKRSGRGVTLRIYGDDSMHHQVLLGFKGIRLHRAECDIRLKPTIEPCLKAVASTQYNLSGLSLDLRSRYMDPSERRFLLDSNTTPFSALQSLFLIVPPGYHVSGMETLHHVVSQAQCLQSFKVDFDTTNPASQTERHRRVLSSVSSNRLRRFFINKTAVSYDQLVDLVGRHSNGLVVLQITHVVLGGGIWPQFFEWLRDSVLTLRSMHIHDLSVTSGDFVQPLINHPSTTR
ncbi:hypothetical protein AUEXF2481DRAFT_29711 [Aureobasidium subglaciale EXF-2481]|uniref:Uncharacterized protein n=1 Tax=Aureobasidium subglaciale (strain EXF-2481) TaxID=1043005 RepID=A0A074YFZ4_AURSE|nr:uncharacterized protein AUEXF2481DRAFT_29711 [Aureobasidium subglaciale EXF-2481]KEQ94984.1 hypothetical protein AUEXF2481DRAFT_29711 [Aureobasidium subglaciale EXF-2481]